MGPGLAVHRALQRWLAPGQRGQRGRGRWAPTTSPPGSHTDPTGSARPWGQVTASREGAGSGGSPAWQRQPWQEALWLVWPGCGPWAAVYGGRATGQRWFLRAEGKQSPWLRGVPWGEGQLCRVLGSQEGNEAGSESGRGSLRGSGGACSQQRLTPGGGMTRGVPASPLGGVVWDGDRAPRVPALPLLRSQSPLPIFTNKQ